MEIIGLLSTLLGGGLRLVPEIMKLLDAKSARSHELAMLDKQNEADRLKSVSELSQIEAQGRIAVSIEDLKALAAGVTAQSVMTGVRWVDALNQAVRPVLAFQWLIFLWPAVIVAGIVLAVQGGTDVLVAMQSAFGKDEKSMAMSIASFWLVDRTIRYQNK